MGVGVRLCPVEVVALVLQVEAVLDGGRRAEVGGRRVVRQRVRFAVDAYTTHRGSVVTHARHLQLPEGVRLLRGLVVAPPRAPPLSLPPHTQTSLNTTSKLLQTIKSLESRGRIRVHTGILKGKERRLSPLMNAAEKSVQLLRVLVLQPKVYYCDQSDR